MDFNVEELIQSIIVKPTRPLGLYLLIRDDDRKLAAGITLPVGFFEERDALTRQSEQLKSDIDTLHSNREDAIQKAAISAITRLDGEIDAAKAKRAAIASVLESMQANWNAAILESDNVKRHRNLLEERLFGAHWIFNPTDNPVEDAEIKTDQALLNFVFRNREYERSTNDMKVLREPKVKAALEVFKQALREEVELKQRLAA